MKNTFKMTLEVYGTTYSTEVNHEDVGTGDALGVAVGLLLSAGHSLENIKDEMADQYVGQPQPLRDGDKFP